MTPRELAGAIRRASSVFVWVRYSESNEGMFVPVTKAAARELIHETRGMSGIDMAAHLRGGRLDIG